MPGADELAVGPPGRFAAVTLLLAGAVARHRAGWQEKGTFDAVAEEL
jgi:hypothetical protein